MNLFEEEVSAGRQLKAVRMRETRLRFFLAFYFLLSLVLYEHFFFPEVQWSGESSLKCFQAEIFLRSRFHSVAIPRPVEIWDVEGRFFPYPGSSFQGPSGHYYLTQSLAFTGLLGLVKGVFGVWGEGILVAVGTLFLLYTVYRLAEKVVPGLEFAVLLTLGFASPVWLYSTLLWGHTLAAGLFTASVLILTGDSGRKSFGAGVFAGILVALGTWIRPEGHAFALALVLASIGWGTGEGKGRSRCAGAILAGFGAGMVPLWIFHAVVWGRPWVAGVREPGSIASLVGLKTWLLHRPCVLEGILFRTSESALFSLLSGVPVVLWITTAGVRRLRDHLRWVQANLVLILIGGAVALWKAVGSGGGRIDGLFGVMPYVAVALWHWPLLGRAGRVEDGRVRFLIALALLYLAALLLFSPAAPEGFAWGARFAMPVFGILTVLAFRSIEGGGLVRPNRGRALLVALVAVGAIAELAGFYNAWRAESNYSEVLQYLKESHAVAVVGHRDAAVLQALTPLHFDRRLYWTGSEKALRRFLESAKPFPNASVVVLTRKTPLETILPGLIGRSTLITGDYWAWAPGQ